MAKVRFCIDCYNFEDRMGMEGYVVCAKRHTPGTTCNDFIDRVEKSRELSAKKRMDLLIRPRGIR
ncbi:MAG: hypothetical protein QW815_03315 [Nitrososphaerota archaeon]